MSHTLISDFWGDEAQPVAGGMPRSAPGTQDFWVASSTGPGQRTVVWDPQDGTWTVVVMNANGRPGIDVTADLGARMPDVLWISLGVLAGGISLLAAGALLIAGAIRRRNAGPSKPGLTEAAEGRSHAEL